MVAKAVTLSQPVEPKIIDVRLNSAMAETTSTGSIRSVIIAGLTQPIGCRTLPTLLLYDECGLRLYDAITTEATEYYLYPIEEAILKDKGIEVVTAIHGEKGIVDGEVVLELGAGALRKTSHILRNLASLVDKRNVDTDTPPVTYYALDLERSELVRTLNQITMNKNAHEYRPEGENYGALGAELSGKVAVCGMLGTYDGGIQFINQGGLEKLRTADKAEGADMRNGGRSMDHITSRADSSPQSKSSVDSDSDSFSRNSGTTPPSPMWTSSEGKEMESLVSPPLHILFLGSSLGNFSREDMITFLSQLPLRPGSGDTLLLGLDGDNPADLVERAYNDKKGITKEFIMNGLRGAGRALGDEHLFVESKWEYTNFYNKEKRRHEAYYKSVGRQTLKIPAANEQDTEVIVDFADGELIEVEVSHKYSADDKVALFSSSNLRVIQEWKDPEGLYSLVLLERPPFRFPLIGLDSNTAVDRQPLDIAALLNGTDKSLGPFSVPTVSDWREMWKAWDSIALGMIPTWMLHQKPIDLRHRCLFYLGHIPAFLDIHLSRLLEEPNTEPEHYKYLFERGIDPVVDDPTQINHSHSEVPAADSDWPTLEAILDFHNRFVILCVYTHQEGPRPKTNLWILRKRGYALGYAASTGIHKLIGSGAFPVTLNNAINIQVSRVRQRLLKLYEDLSTGKRVLTRKVARVLFMTYEHEGLHAETLLYMLIQRAGSGTLTPPSFSAPRFAELAKAWDDEYSSFYNSPSGSVVTLGPRRVVLGHDDRESDDLIVPFDPKHEFGWDNESPRREVDVGKFKISWRPVTNGEFYQYWLDASKDQTKETVAMPASWVKVDGVVHVRTIYGPISMEITKHWPVQTNYDDLSTYAKVKGGRIPTMSELRAFWEQYQNGFVGSTNVGFSHWHPTPATTGVKDGGRGHNGGVWEWTSTKLDQYEGYIPSELYPGYSMDFFDHKHQVVIGGSYVTIPRIAQRGSFVNFYQHNYPYAWIGARIAYDV